MKMVHRIDYGQPIRDFMKGIREDDYLFYDDYPECKEVLVVGSSNSGKSSFINALNNGQEIARVRKLSGKTESLNFYLCKKTVNLKKGEMKRGMVIDSPGYGYTAAPVKIKNQWKKLMTMYLSHAVRLRLVLMLVDSKRGLVGSDKQML